MRRNLFVATVLIALLLNTTNSFGWGQKGHDIIARIAEAHLTPKAQKAVNEALDGYKMMYYSSWMDNVRNQPEYKSMKTWHYANVDEGESYQTMQKSSDGDVYTALTQVISTLKSGKANDSVSKLYIKVLVHLMGDLHCPMHAGRLTDLGGNRFPVKWFGNATNLHAIWDTDMIESTRKWSYSEWQQNIDVVSAKQVAEITSGNPLKWFNETVDIGKGLYLNAEENMNCSYDYMKDNYPTLEQQLLRAGYRLAAVLNEIYK